jgi:hypothetical protein
MTELSPQTQAVLDAAFSAYWSAEQEAPNDEGMIAAAALRAVADQVVPDDAVEPRNYLPMAMECQRIRRELLAIAAELEANETRN